MRRQGAFTISGAFIFAACAVFAAFLLCMPLAAQAATSMIESVEAAFAFNPELKASQHNRAAAELALDRARSGFLPSLSLYAGGGTGRLDDSYTRLYGEDNEWHLFGDASLRLVQPLWHGGATMADFSGRKAQLLSAGYLLEDKASSLAFDALAAHIEVTRRALLVELARKNVAEHEEILNTVRKRYNTHIATVGELNQVESRYARAQATLVSYESSLVTALALYKRITGQDAGPLADPVPPTLPFASAQDVREACLVNHPRILSAQAEVDALQADRDAAQSRFFPQIDLEAGPSWSERDSAGQSHSTDISAELRMRWDIFNGGADYATVSLGGERISQARQTLRALSNTLVEDIDATYSRYESSLAQSELYEKAKRASRLSREDFYRQFLAAQRTLIDVLDAENDFFYAASQQAIVDADRAIAGYRLLALSGSLLPALGLDPALLQVNPAPME